MKKLFLQWRCHTHVLAILCAGFLHVANSQIVEDSLAQESAPCYINKIVISGCKVSDEALVRRIAALTKGMLYDTSIVNLAKKQLEKTGAFISVACIPVTHDANVDLYIVVQEKFYLSVSEYGGEINSTMYGLPKNWVRARVGLAYSNVGGRFETLKLRVSGWESRGASLSWTKPFLPSPYYVSVGGGVGYGPERSTPWQRLSVDGSITTGMNILAKSRLFLNLNPAYRNMSYRGPDSPGTLSGAYSDSVLYSQSDFQRMRPDTGWKKRYYRTSNGADTVWDTVRWDGNKTYINPQSRSNRSDTLFTELMLSTGVVFDYRDKSFNPHKGFLVSSVITSNYLYPYKPYYKYIESSTDFRLYHRGFASHNTMAYWIKLTMRNGDAGIFKHLAAGGDGSLRGYASDALSGTGYGANNSLVGSLEYRFPIFTMPAIDFSVISDLLRPFSAFSTRFDGAVFIDCAHIWKSAFKPLEIDAINNRPLYNDGVGYGVALRLLSPSIGRSGCIDFGMAPPTRDNAGKLQFHNGWHVYLDMNF